MHSTTDPVANSGPQLHSEDMAAWNYFNHVSRDGRSTWDRTREQVIAR